MPYAAMMVHIEVDRDSEQKIQLALDLADRFEASLIGIAGVALRPAFSAAGLVVFAEPTEGDLRRRTPSFDELGENLKSRAATSSTLEWRSALEPPARLLAREARAADLVIVGRRHEVFDRTRRHPEHRKLGQGVAQEQPQYRVNEGRIGDQRQSDKCARGATECERQLVAPCDLEKDAALNDKGGREQQGGRVDGAEVEPMEATPDQPHIAARIAATIRPLRGPGFRTRYTVTAPSA